MSSAPKTIRERITGHIRDELVAGRFAPGSTLRETELASRFGVSRGPIRDAFLQLSQEGFLAYQANRGVTVRHPPDPDDREFITSVRKQMETHVLKKGLAKISDESIKIIESKLANLKDACDAGDVAAVARSDMAFHESIMVGCGGEDLVPAWRQLCSRMLLTYTRLGGYDQAHAEHATIFAAIQSRQIAAASAALVANIK
ncbi:GntR family transcriptional regulator [Novipirellula artificiosorum]|uniref:HTH-type transcriptional repressor CsiR n=1 Tax=Novipirellula artificiosorum TaxID=2528016 RepID=A0A5C6DSF9_9BACT|nr:GntR family transcriptional regulator [Novipirellula artificiosorum]TWU38421.1 HTH-type transcriptional repressor CsiR [Novipirellula artificiosorum]